ncbi:DUF2878 domain-containing protein [Gilvimarinus sp. 2_MG-2023]|uniref:DUF2878 domain-containing protein n=1 Tax=Gilvimarinus sp. 2_MG-2023 TaxID=3062666 RepID=UPI0026E24BB0|nr:DUF2878 domain-containing protein [Gilvimarinus sp. 2_MG-2023]MDO6571792.1 DUF2878 domain-containing protein [Gilvimarinus sp. 2_MG-2023]
MLTGCRRLFIFANFLMFQVGWAIAVMLGSRAAIAYVIFAGTLHFYYSTTRRFDYCAVLPLFAIGYLHDVALLLTGVLVIGDSIIPPPWLSAIWVLLGLTLNHSLHFIYRNKILASLLGAVGGAVAYSAGVKLSGAQWGILDGWGSLIIAFAWLFILPLHYSLMKKFVQVET